MIEEIYDFRDYLVKELKLSLENAQQELDYYQILPYSIKEIEIESSDGYEEYGHPIKWLIKGSAGAQAFMIGKADSHMGIAENMSEKNYYPNLLTNNFSQIGLEYIYSQVAIVIIDENTDETVLNWLRKWSDDPRYFRKIIVSEYKSRELKATVNYIFEKVFYPWQSIKRSSDISNSSQLTIFEEDYEEEESE